jgi:hypothetical protein
MYAPLSANTRSTSSRLAPASDRNSRSRYSSSPEKYKSEGVHAAVATQRVGYSVVRAGDEPSSDIDMSITTLVTGTSSQARSWSIRSVSEYMGPFRR